MLEEQSFETANQASITGRGPDGKFLPGFSGNPAGAPQIAGKGWQRYGDRLKHLLETYTPDQLIEFAESRYARSKLSSIDAIAAVHIGRSLEKELTATRAGTDDLRGERKELLDRIEGQTKALTEITGANGAAITPLIKIVFEGNNSAIEQKTEEQAAETIVIEQAPTEKIPVEIPAAENIDGPKVEFE